MSSRAARGITSTHQAARACFWLRRQACPALESVGLCPHAAAPAGRFRSGKERRGNLLVGRARGRGEEALAPPPLPPGGPAGAREEGLPAPVLPGRSVDARPR